MFESAPPGVVLLGAGAFWVFCGAAGGVEFVLEEVLLSGAGVFCVSWANPDKLRISSMASAGAMARNFMGSLAKPWEADLLIILPLTRVWA